VSAVYGEMPTACDSKYQNAQRIGALKFYFASADVKFKYLGTTVINQNLIQEVIKRRLISGNSCYHFVKILLVSRSLAKNFKIRIFKTIILPVVLYGCGTWSLPLREEHRAI
jgi:hypothetical protein